MVNDIIINSLNYYDTNYEKYDKLIESIVYIKFIRKNNDLEHNVLIFYDKNKKEIFQSKYEIIGIYNKSYNLWVWAWAMPKLKKNLSYISRKILTYGLDLDYDKNYIKSELITSRFKITNQTQLDIHISIASYLAKIPMIYKFVSNPYNTEDPNSDNMIKIIDENNEFDTDLNVNYYLFILDSPKN